MTLKHIKIIGHRGASGYLPENTLAAFSLAIEMGANAIELDIVPTKERELIARHENDITHTTNISHLTEFSDRLTVKSINGQEITGWFTEDFTLAEIKTLTAKAPPDRQLGYNLKPAQAGFVTVAPPFRVGAPDRQLGYNLKPAQAGFVTVAPPFRVGAPDRQLGYNLKPAQAGFVTVAPPFRVGAAAVGAEVGAVVPTLQEVIDLVKHQRTAAGRAIGLYIEIKHSTYFRTMGLPIEEPLVEILEKNGYRTADAPIFRAAIAIESFESESLKHLHQLTQVPLVQLRQDLTSASELANIAEYAVGLAAYKRLIVPTDERGHLLAPTSLIQDAHQVNLKVYSWTFRNEKIYLAPEYKGNPQAEYEQFLLLGLDGVFSDFPDTAVSVRDRFHPSQ